MQIKLMYVITDPELDPYSGNESVTSLWINLESLEYGLYQEFNDNSTPEDEWNGRVINASLEFRPDETMAKKYLASPACKSLIECIIGNSDINNNVGIVSNDAESALDEIIVGLKKLPENENHISTPEDYLQYSGLNVSDKTPKELSELAKKLSAEALENHLLIDEIDFLEFFGK